MKQNITYAFHGSYESREAPRAPRRTGQRSPGPMAFGTLLGDGLLRHRLPGMDIWFLSGSNCDFELG